MHWGVWVVVIGVSWTFSASHASADKPNERVAGAKRAEAPGALQSLYDDMTALLAELPVDTLEDAPAKDTRKKYNDAAGQFKAAADAPSGSAARYRATARATAELREVGLWIPFAAAAPDKRETLVRRFIDLEDRALALTNAVYATVTTGADAPFQLGREQWRLMPGAVTWREAEIRCSSLAFDGTKRWRLPDLNELWRTQAVMKDARTNTGFGLQAEKLAKVWTGSKAPGEKQQYYVDFKTAKIEISVETAKLETVCVGEMEDGS